MSGKTGLWVKMLTLSIFVGLFNGCASNTHKMSEIDPAADPQEQLEMASGAYMKTIGQGAIVGAVLGGVAGALLGGSDGAKIGAVAGAVLGGIGGGIVADTQNSFASRESQIDDLVVSLEQENEELSRYVIVARDALDDARGKIAKMHYLEAAKSQDVQIISARLKSLQTSRDLLAKVTNGLRDRRDELVTQYKELSSEPAEADEQVDWANVDTGIKKYSQDIAELETVLQEYDDLLVVESVGSTS